MANDHVYEMAKRELEDLQARCLEIETFLAEYERYRKQSDDIAPLVDAAAAGAAKAVVPKANASSTQIMSEVHDILKERGDALTLKSIFDQLTARGVVVGGANPKQNLSQKLSAEASIKSYGKRGWYFADTVPPCAQPRYLSSGTNEEGPDSMAAEPLQSDGSEDQISRSTSVPSGRDMSLAAIVSSAPQHQQERGKAWSGKPSVDYQTPAS